MNSKIETRKYKSGDAAVLVSIYYHTIHRINIRDYSAKQINAWAPSSLLGLDGWKRKWKKLVPIVALFNNEIVGFAEFEENGYIDCFYVHHEFQNIGVGSTLMHAIECEAQMKNIDRIYANVSITAKSFFARKGFATVKK